MSAVDARAPEAPYLHGAPASGGLALAVEHVSALSGRLSTGTLAVRDRPPARRNGRAVRSIPDDIPFPVIGSKVFLMFHESIKLK